VREPASPCDQGMAAGAGLSASDGLLSRRRETDVDARLVAAKGGQGALGHRFREDGWVGDWRGDAVAFRFQPPPVEPCVRFSRTRLTDVLHRRCSTGARQGRLGLGATMIPLRLIRPNASRDR